jgi:DNA-binding response OmpR family regulator
MLTANAGAADRARAESLGADDFIAKPFDPAEVVERIHARLRA